MLGTKSIFPICFIIIVCISAGLLFANASFNKYNFRDLKNDNYNITATIAEKYDDNDKTSLLLTNIKIENKEYNFCIKGSAENLYVNVKCGDVVNFDGYLYVANLVSNNKLNTYILKNNLQYYAYINVDTLSVIDYEFNLINNFKDKTKTLLTEHMSDENAGFAFATICGDKTLLSDTYYQTFKNAGLAHILAVSGLHVGFLVGAIIFILKLLKINTKYQFYIIAILLFVYCMLCGFAPSILRASIMSLCLSLGMVLGERNDTLSNLSLAGVLVLLIQPLYLYDVGFLLSFASVFGILFLQKPFCKLLCKIKIPKVLSEMFAVSIGATIATIPVIFSCFGEISIISLLSNLVVLPIFSMMFIVLLVSVFINLIVPLPFLISIAEFFVNIVVTLSAVFAKVAMVKTFAFDVLSSIAYYLLIFFCSPFVMISFNAKAILFYAIYMACAPYLTFVNAERYFENNYMSVVGSVSDTLFVTTESNCKILIGAGKDKYDLKNISTMLKSSKVQNIDYLILVSYKDEYQTNVSDIVAEFDISNILVFGDFGNSTKIGLASVISASRNLEFLNVESFNDAENNFSLKLLSINSKTKAVDLTIDKINILKLESTLTKLQYSNNSHFFKSYDICFAENYQTYYSEILFYDSFVCHSLKNSQSGIIYVETNELWTFD